MQEEGKNKQENKKSALEKTDKKLPFYQLKLINALMNYIPTYISMRFEFVLPGPKRRLLVFAF